MTPVAALREALPRAVNFRIPVALPVDDPTWDVIAAELDAALHAAAQADTAPGEAGLSASYWKALWETSQSTVDRLSRAALAAPSRDAGLDVERLALAMGRVLDTTTRRRVVPYADKLAAEYARLSPDADGAPFPAGVNRADSEGEG